MSLLYIKIHYGPCDSFNTLAHKPQKLYGLKDRLLKLGYRVNLRPMEHLNLCVIEMCNHEIFRCNINNLSFNTSYYKDKVCQRAVDVVVDASASFLRARSYLWASTIIDKQLFGRNDYTSKDYWYKPVTFKPLDDVIDCANCCGILITEKTAEDFQKEKGEKDKLRLEQFEHALRNKDEREKDEEINKLKLTDANLAAMIRDLKIDLRSTLSENFEL